MTFPGSNASNGTTVVGGFVRLALATAALACLVRWWVPQDVLWAYPAAALSVILGLLAILRPRIFARRLLVLSAADALVLGLLLAETGGSDSPFFVLYFPAALSVAHLAGRASIGPRAEGVAAGAAALALVGGYLLASLVAGGWGGIGSARSFLNVIVLSAFCAAMLCGGVVARRTRGRAEKARDAIATQASDERTVGLVRAFGPALDTLDYGSALAAVAEAARAVTGGTYAHVAALRGAAHRTVMQADGDADACPSWWHPSVQRLLLWSCREGRPVRSAETVHGVEGFLAVPVGSPDGERWGAVIVGGGRLGEDEERTLSGLAAALPVMGRGPDAERGSDLASGLPNTASLFHALRREISAGGTPDILAVDVRASDPGKSEELLRRFGERLEKGGRRTFRCGEGVLVVLAESETRGPGERTPTGKARSLRRILREESDTIAGGPTESAVGFAQGRMWDQGPEGLVGTALGALREAWESDERIAGAAEPTRTAAAPALDVGAPSVRGFRKATAARDPYLAAHSMGVSRVARRIGLALSLSEDQLVVLEIGSLLHDVGKIGIPDRILHKPGGLSDEEYAVVKRHPDLGADMLAPLPDLAAALPAVRHHHERLDGRGYPHGLRGDEIPLSARVVSVADAFDSMTRERPYGRPVTAMAAVEEIQHNAGTQFDPRIARALTQVILDPDNPREGFAV